VNSERGKEAAEHVRQFGDLEADIMGRLWLRDRPTTVRDVLNDLRQERPLAYTTVMTVMDKLYRKGWLSREREGRAFLYSPVASREEYSAGLMAQALDTSSDRVATLVRFFEQMSPDEAQTLRSALESVESHDQGEFG
jgi:predicted transcriptional regulator